MIDTVPEFNLLSLYLWMECHNAMKEICNNIGIQIQFNPLIYIPMQLESFIIEMFETFRYKYNGKPLIHSNQLLLLLMDNSCQLSLVLQELKLL
jgi:hypothetical protein